MSAEMIDFYRDILAVEMAGKPIPPVPSTARTAVAALPASCGKKPLRFLCEAVRQVNAVRLHHHQLPTAHTPRASLGD